MRTLKSTLPSSRHPVQHLFSICLLLGFLLLLAGCAPGGTGSQTQTSRIRVFHTSDGSSSWQEIARSVA